MLFFQIILCDKKYNVQCHIFGGFPCMHCSWLVGVAHLYLFKNLIQSKELYTFHLDMSNKHSFMVEGLHFVTLGKLRLCTNEYRPVTIGE